MTVAFVLKARHVLPAARHQPRRPTRPTRPTASGDPLVDTLTYRRCANPDPASSAAAADRDHQHARASLGGPVVLQRSDLHPRHVTGTAGALSTGDRARGDADRGAAGAERQRRRGPPPPSCRAVCGAQVLASAGVLAARRLARGAATPSGAATLSGALRAGRRDAVGRRRPAELARGRRRSATSSTIRRWWPTTRRRAALASSADLSFSDGFATVSSALVGAALLSVSRTSR